MVLQVWKLTQVGSPVSTVFWKQYAHGMAAMAEGLWINMLVFPVVMFTIRHRVILTAVFHRELLLINFPKTGPVRSAVPARMLLRKSKTATVVRGTS